MITPRTPQWPMWFARMAGGFVFLTGVVVLLGWLCLQAQHAGWFGTEAGVALFSLSSVVFFGMVIWITASLLRRVDTNRKQTEEMRASYAEIVESSDDAIIGKTLEGIITSWNRGAEHIFGYTAGEIVGKSMLTLFPPDLAGEEADILWRLSRGERIDHYETVRIRKDGRRVDVSVTTSPIKDESGKITGVSKIARDITEQKRAEKKAAWLASFPGRNPNPIIEFDWAKSEIRYVNPFAARQFPDLESLGLGHPWLAGLKEEARDLVDGKTDVLRRDVMVGETCYSQTISHIPEAGCVRVYATDITQRKQTEQRLQSQLERLDLLYKITRATGERQDLKSILQVVIRSLEDHLPVDFCCMCLYDPVSKALTVSGVGIRSRMLAMELAMTEQSSIPIDENGLSRCVQGQLVYEADIAQVQFPFPQRLARVGLRSLVAAPLLVESSVFGVLIVARGKPDSFSSGECEFLRQLSEHTALAAHQAQLYGALRQAYNDLRQTQQAVMQQERLRALGQMASGIAHDINNAISPASLYTESLLENEPNLSERARDYLGTIQNALEDVAETVARMREFYRQREPQLTLERVDLNSMAEQVINLSRARWSGMPQQRGVVITMQQELASDLPQIMGVESEIREALINLVFNAVDAMPEGGILTLRTQSTETPAGLGSGLRVTVEVSDTGVGMSEDTRSQCLEPFFTTKGERGTGLGLAMVYGMVQRHGAEIDVQSFPGKGTTVRLDFPVAPTAGEESFHPATETLAVPSRLRILTVDDDPVVIKSLQDTLETDGHVVTSASDGREGIDAFRSAMERKEPFDVVITDLGMPYVDGRKVVGAVKGMSPGTPVILLTGWGQRLVAEGDIPPHVDCILNKPPKLRTLREALAQCLHRRGDV